MRERERKLARKRLDIEMRSYRQAGREKNPTNGLLRAVRQVDVADGGGDGLQGGVRDCAEGRKEAGGAGGGAAVGGSAGSGKTAISGQRSEVSCQR